MVALQVSSTIKLVLVQEMASTVELDIVKLIHLLHNALLALSLQSCLVNPFMMHLTGVQVDECPNFLAVAPSNSHHSLFFPNDDILEFPWLLMVFFIIFHAASQAGRRFLIPRLCCI